MESAKRSSTHRRLGPVDHNPNMTFELVEAQRLPIEELCRRYGVTRLWLFGSAATGRYDPNKSNIDLLVEFGPPAGMSLAAQYFDFWEKFKTLFQREVDLVGRSAIRNPVFLRNIERQERLLYAA
ncbi:MAG: Nucleotidyltransferase domain protein [Armatimonadetes bacterium OLB18]|nr:MAG: Nucleotidyltransferase domain protein [Armatimonadetes bacterium OLB18]